MGRDRIHLPGIPRDAARVLIAELEALKDEQARLRRKAGRPGIVTSDYSAKAGEFVNVEPRSGTLVTITLPESTPALRGARVTLAFRNSNEVRIVAVQGTVNGESFVINDRPGTYDATADGLGGWFVQVGVSDEGSGAGGGGGGGGFTPTFAAPTDVGTANAEGVATTLVRSDHVHKLNFGSPVAVGAANADGVASTAARSDHVHKAYATGAEDGFLSRRIYVHASSAALGISSSGVTTEAAVTWTTSADIPDGNWFRIVLIAGGGSGSSGLNGHTTGGHGGTGGGGGAWRSVTISRAELVALLPITISPALEVSGGAGVTQTTASNGAAGNNGNNTSFGPWTVYGGGGGNQSNAGQACSGGGGGGWQGAGAGGRTDGITGLASQGGPPLPGQNAAAVTSTSATVIANSNDVTSVFGGGTCQLPSSSSNGQSGYSVFGGGAGGGSGTANTNVRPGGLSTHGGGGGGASTFANGTGAPGGTPQAGGASSDGMATGGAAGSNSTGTATPGATGTASPDIWEGSGGGGGAGGSAANTTATTAGAGGAGGFPGGGGGGGGTAIASAGVNATSGSGGAGGPGAVGVEAWA